MRIAGRKLSSENYARLTARDSWREQSHDEHAHGQRTALAVIDATPPDDVNSPFFLSASVAQTLAPDEFAALDSMLEKHGLKNLLDSIVQLLESRIDAGLIESGRPVLYLAKENLYAYAAECVRNVTFDKRIREL